MMKQMFALVLSAVLAAGLLAGCKPDAPAGGSPASPCAPAPGSVAASAVSTGESAQRVRHGGVLADNWDSFQIQIDGEVYQFPMSYGDLLSYGWVPKRFEATDTVEPSTINFKDFERDGALLTFHLKNADPENKCALGDCTVAALMLGLKETEEYGLEVLLPGGLELGVATPEDLRAHYGEPDNVAAYESGGVHSFYYDGANGGMCSYWFDAETQVLTDVKINA